MSTQNHPRSGNEHGTVCPKGKAKLRPKQYMLVKWLFPITGLAALVWFLIRVIPKPSRATYPCQRAVAPLASGFVVWLLGLVGSTMFVRKARRHRRKARYAVAVACFVAAVFAIWWSAGMTGRYARAEYGGTFTPVDPPNSPMGVGKGVHPGRVVWVHDPRSATWEKGTGYWWNDDYTNPEWVREMFSNSIQWLTGQATDSGAWESIFRYYNQRHDKVGIGYQQGEKIAIKCNLNQCSSHGNEGNKSYTAPQLLEALLKQLVNVVGVAPSDITVYDASRRVPSTLYDLCSGRDLVGLRFADTAGGDGRIRAERDPKAMIHPSNPGVPPRWMPDFVSEASYLINLAGLKGHVLTGATLCAKNHFGSTWVEDGRRFWPGNAIHGYVNAFDTTQPWGESGFNHPARPMGSYEALVDLMGYKHLGGKTILYIVDALYGALNMGTSVRNSPKWQMEPFNNDWPSSLFVSQDPVAIDSVCIDFLRSEPTMTYIAAPDNYSTVDDYLHEAAMAHDPCSGTFYDPDGTSLGLQSLGVHEHWNNATDKQYSRNLGTGDGIELISSVPSECLELFTEDINGDSIEVVLAFQDDFEANSLDAWQATDPDVWQIEQVGDTNVLSLTGQSNYTPPYTSPSNINLVQDVVVGSFMMELQLNSTVNEYPHRDLCLFFGYQDPANYFYVHIASQPDTVAHKIHVVDDGDRTSITDDHNSGVTWDSGWHTARVLRDIDLGIIKVYFDDMSSPIMTAIDRRFQFGKVGVGSFDDTGQFDNVSVWLTIQSSQ